MKKIDRQRVISFLGFCIFVGIIVQVFFGVTYLFRNTNDDRRHIAGLKQEKVLDSEVFVPPLYMLLCFLLVSNSLHSYKKYSHIHSMP